LKIPKILRRRVNSSNGTGNMKNGNSLYGCKIISNDIIIYILNNEQAPVITAK